MSVNKAQLLHSHCGRWQGSYNRQQRAVAGQLQQRAGAWGGGARSPTIRTREGLGGSADDTRLRLGHCSLLKLQQRGAVEHRAAAGKGVLHTRKWVRSAGDGVGRGGGGGRCRGGRGLHVRTT